MDEEMIIEITSCFISFFVTIFFFVWWYFNNKAKKQKKENRELNYRVETLERQIKSLEK